MARRIAVCNQKGGVGKSTTAVNVGSYLALSGRKTLLIDLDPQGNATIAAGVSREQVSRGIYEVLVDQLPITEAIVPTAVERLDLVPASLDLAGAEPRLVERERRESILKELCEPLDAQYDFILFDCPPSLGLLTVNALVAAQRTVIPVQCEYLALEGLTALMRAVELVRRELNPALQLGGIVLTMTDFRATLAREVAEEVRRYFKEQVFATAIPRNIRLAESPSYGKPICLYDPKSPGAMAYRLLTEELMTREGAGIS